MVVVAYLDPGWGGARLADEESRVEGARLVAVVTESVFFESGVLPKSGVTDEGGRPYGSTCSALTGGRIESSVCTCVG